MKRLVFLLALALVLMPALALAWGGGGNNCEPQEPVCNIQDFNYAWTADASVGLSCVKYEESGYFDRTIKDITEIKCDVTACPQSTEFDWNRCGDLTITTGPSCDFLVRKLDSSVTEIKNANFELKQKTNAASASVTTVGGASFCGVADGMVAYTNNSAQAYGYVTGPTCCYSGDSIGSGFVNITSTFNAGVAQ